MTTVEEYKEIRKNPAEWVRHMVLCSPLLRKYAPNALNDLEVKRSTLSDTTVYLVLDDMSVQISFLASGYASVYADVPAQEDARYASAVFPPVDEDAENALDSDYELYKFVCEQVQWMERRYTAAKKSGVAV